MSDQLLSTQQSVPTPAAPTGAAKESPLFASELHPHHRRLEERLEKFEGRIDMMMVAIILLFAVVAGAGLIVSVSHTPIRW